MYPSSQHSEEGGRVKTFNAIMGTTKRFKHWLSLQRPLSSSRISHPWAVQGKSALVFKRH